MSVWDWNWSGELEGSSGHKYSDSVGWRDLSTTFKMERDPVTPDIGSGCLWVVDKWEQVETKGPPLLSLDSNQKHLNSLTSSKIKERDETVTDTWGSFFPHLDQVSGPEETKIGNSSEISRRKWSMCIISIWKSPLRGNPSSPCLIAHPLEWDSEFMMSGSHERGLECLVL